MRRARTDKSMSVGGADFAIASSYRIPRTGRQAVVDGELLRGCEGSYIAIRVGSLHAHIVSAGGRGISCFLVEKEWGIQIKKHEDKMGLRGSPTGEVVLDEVRVPASHRLGEEGQGFTIRSEEHTSELQSQ